MADSITMRVNGIRGLHVGDASAMPALPRANAPTIMIAERTAHVMRKASSAGVRRHRQSANGW
nr:GMC oxidoreductase [Nocardia arthritidis]